MPGDEAGPGHGDGSPDEPDTLCLSADAVEAVVDLASGGRLASFAVDGHELLRTAGDEPC